MILFGAGAGQSAARVPRARVAGAGATGHHVAMDGGGGMTRVGWPMAGRGQAVGLLGGSFDPAHGGHAAITLEALKRFRLDRVWWLVSPGNPLKPDAPAALERRLSRARRLMRHPRVEVTALETAFRTRYTADTVDRLTEFYPGVRLVWLMGSDNLAGFHLWDRWRDIAARVPIGVLARPGERLSGLGAPAARVLEGVRCAPGALARAAPPAWAFVNIPLRHESSTGLRASGDWQQ